ncbi:hypothetical protein QBC38DRAFT_466146 [Podospora fimiseda]|uniref:Uncharacterized protein n=1 Tax=Podospora fimiseda TaxID=252190 RepID=A0AAN7BXS5_9PEZI|nr:hypothetical protein QBC38DRAFT_466146 [Podospora fimiseda]
MLPSIVYFLTLIGMGHFGSFQPAGSLGGGESCFNTPLGFFAVVVAVFWVLAAACLTGIFLEGAVVFGGIFCCCEVGGTDLSS